MGTAPPCYPGMCACLRLLKPTGLESGICLCTPEEAVQRSRLLHGKLILCKSHSSACRGMQITADSSAEDSWERRCLMLPIEHFVCLFWKHECRCCIQLKHPFQSIWFLWIIISSFLEKSDRECGWLGAPRPDADKAFGSVAVSVLIRVTQLLMFGF